MNKLSDNILKTIEEKQLEPKPRWQFLLKDIAVWASSALVVTFGAVAVAVSLAIVSMHDWDIAERLEHSPLGFFFLSLPYAWIVLFIGLMILADYNIRHTKGGYRFSLWKLASVVLILSISCGGLLFAAGVGNAVDDTLAEQVPLYQRIGNRRALHLLNPEQGILAGKIISLPDDTLWEVRDIEGTVWMVDVSEAEIIGQRGIQENKPIRILGKQSDVRSFTAEEILPMRPPRELRDEIRSRKRGIPPPPDNMRPHMQKPLR